MAAIGSFSLLRNCAETQRAFSNVKLSQSVAFSFNSIKFFHPRLSQRCGKKEEDDGKDKEIERLEGEIGIKNSHTDQQSVGEKVIKRFEHRIEAKDEKIRLLEDELAMKDEEIQRLKSQLDRKGKEYGRLRNNIESACTDMENAVAILGSAFMFTVENPPEKGNGYSYDLIGAMSSAGDDMWLKYLSAG